MEIAVKYLGMITEVTGCGEEVISSKGGTISDFTALLLDKYPSLKTKSFVIAQNQAIVSETIELTGEEIAVLPPFSGG